MLKIVTYPEPILRQKADPVTDFDIKLTKLIKNMTDTLGSKGIGLAAPQVSVNKRLMIVSIPKEDKRSPVFFPPTPFINPRILTVSENTETMTEGCLSLPEIEVDVTRPVSVEVAYQNSKGEKQTIFASDLLARVIQHEIDHLNGILIIDHGTPKKVEKI